MREFLSRRREVRCKACAAHATVIRQRHLQESPELPSLALFTSVRWALVVADHEGRFPFISMTHPHHIGLGLGMVADITLILGGARSGKSRYGESLALALDLTPVYLATAEARDEEMRTRIAHHQRQRASQWQTIEVPLTLATAIEEEASPDRVLLVDCLTLWLTNHLEQTADLDEEVAALCHALLSAKGPVIVISNEVGHGIVPANAMARGFRDEAGRLNQQVAAVASNVFLVVAGLSIPLKRGGRPLDTFLQTKDHD